MPSRQDATHTRPFEGAWQDVRFTLRRLRKSPGFAAAAMLTFALGIGANTAVFSVVSGILLRPLPFATPERLAAIWPAQTISNAELEYMQQHATTFASVAAFSPGWGVAMTGIGEPEQLNAARVSTNFFQTLGVSPVLGRAFANGESESGNWNVAILSHELWVTHFGSDPSIVSRVVDMDGSPTKIIGVMPAGFEVFQAGVDAWLPLQIDPSSRFHTGQTALGLGRLAPNATLAAATAELATFIPRMRETFNYAPDYARGATVGSLHDALVGNARRSLLVLFGAALAVLLIAGANVGNLMLLHATSRVREISVRRALGASRGRVAWQLLVQSVILAAAGGVLGVASAVAGVHGLKAILPGTLPLLSAVSIDARVLAVTLVVTIGIGIAFGVAPALLATRVDPGGALRASAATSGGRAGVATRRALVVLEIALAMVLVVGAGLMTESLWRLSRVSLGFDPRGLLSFRIQPSSGQVKSAEQTRTYFEEMTRRLAAIPGVQSVGAAQHLPLSGFNWRADLDIERSPRPAGKTPDRLVWRTVVGDYFTAMKIPLVRGRVFTDRDVRGAPPVVIINEPMATKFWPDRDPVGERIRLGNGSANDWATIVGVVGGVRFQSPTTEPTFEVYRPNAQQGLVFMHFVVRTSGAPLALMPAVRTAVRSLDTTVPIAEVRSLGDMLLASTATPRTIAILLLGFAGVGLVLGMIGIYGVVSYAVGQRTRELGIRVALGAVESRVVTMVLGDGARLAGAGILIGTLAALVATRSLRSLVFGVATTSVPIYLGVAFALASMGVAASYLPARRAARVDPLVALRAE